MNHRISKLFFGILLMIVSQITLAADTNTNDRALWMFWIELVPVTQPEP